MTEHERFEPDWVSPPGDTIADALDELGMTQADLAQRTGFTRKHINGLIKGSVLLSADAALRLESVLGEPVSFWLKRDALFRESLARQAARKMALGARGWLRQIPVDWMEKQGWLPRHKNEEEQVESCLRFFGVASVHAWRAAYLEPLAATRTTTSAGSRLGSMTAWLRRGEQLALEQDCAGYEKQAFRSALDTLKRLTAEPDPRVLVNELQGICAACGVSVVFVASPPSCPLQGVAKWMTPTKAMLALGLDHKTNDQLWFRFLHSAAHLLKHGKKQLYMEGVGAGDPQQEEQANRFAFELWIPPAEAGELATLSSMEEVKSMARRLGLAPGLLVHRMQAEGWIPRTSWNSLKIRYKKAGLSGVNA